MLLVFARVCFLVVLFCPLVVADEPDIVGDNPDGVVEMPVLEKDQGRFIKMVQFDVPWEKRDDLELRFSTPDGPHGRITLPGIDSESCTTKDIYTIRISDQNRGERYWLWIHRKMKGSRFEIVVDDRAYFIEAEEGILPKHVPQKDIWAALFSSRATEPSLETQRICKRASVRIKTPFHGGCGTDVVPPHFLEESVKTGERVVLTAEHVIARCQKEHPILIEVFQYNGLAPGKFRQYEAKVLFRDPINDIAALAYTIPNGEYAPKSVPVAESLRWFSLESRYFRVGCPGGSAPQHQLVRAVKAKRDGESGILFIDTGSQGGHSGGGIFDADGNLVAVVTETAKEHVQLDQGRGLVGPRARRYRRTRFPKTSVRFTAATHVHSATLSLGVVEAEAVEKTRKQSIVLPKPSKHGPSVHRQKHFVEARNGVDEMVAGLNPDDREQVSAAYLKAIELHEQALARSEK